MGERRTLVAAGTLLGASFVALRVPRLNLLDRRAGIALSRPMGDTADTVITAATDLGSVFAIIGLSGTLAVSGRRRLAFEVFGAGSTAWVLAQGAKPLVSRPRPFEADGAVRLVSTPSGSSWPSGHVAVAAAMASVIAPDLGPVGRLVATVTAGFVGLSRVYVGVHYVTDIVAGIGVGLASGTTWRLIDRTGRHILERGLERLARR